ncbi:uncharacterized protein LOC123691896 [Colias croceus]|uniref:uncharacterized protein LOC123691896 n=1 Tax=Colias crocea TaxID=72248 RepID=UPI001E27DA1B|nr:uncharacterized protein LOC123691896 [Colias croceus]
MAEETEANRGSQRPMRLRCLEDICYRRIKNLVNSNLSTLWLRIDCDDHPRVYACVYRLHSGDAETDRLMEHLQITADAALEQIPSAEIIVLGDFNAHHTQWLGSRLTDHAGRSVYDFALANGLRQLVSSITRLPDVVDHTPSMLDLLLTSHPNNYQVNTDAPLGTSDHCLVRSVVPILRSRRPRSGGCRRVWHYRAADWDGMREFFSSYPWKQVCFAHDPSAYADSVADVVLQGMELFIPSSVVPIGGKSQPWYGHLCKEAFRQKQDCFRNWADAFLKQDPNASALKKQYNFACRQYKRKMSIAKSEFIRGIGKKLTRFPSGSRAFWSLAKAIQGNFCQPTFPPLRREDDTLAHSPKEKADLLGALFASNSTLDDRGKHSYDVGIAPASWKTAAVHPIPKKGDQSDPSNYRPIAITSLLSKAMESIINRQLLGYLEENQLISDHQYGFRHGRSACDLLVFLTHRWAAAIESKGEALAVSLDVAKAFDRVWHRALLSKLTSYGLPEKLRTWIASFLAARNIRVLVDGSCSELMPVNAGVPQGCVLSPTLFLLHINDMLQISNIHCYADDSTGDASYTGHANFSRENVDECRNTLVSKIETLLEEVSKWGRKNLVEFNPTKTQLCAFTAKKKPFESAPLFMNTPLSVKSSIAILGVNISDDVQFRDHLEGKASLASKKLGVLYRAKQYFRPDHLLLLYKAQIRPHMEYCSHLWAGAPLYQLLPLDRVQRRAVRMIGDPRLSDRLDPLALRRDIASLCVFYRIYHGECSEELFEFIPAAEFHHRSARHKANFHPHHLDRWRTSTVRFSRHFLPRTTILWNSLPPSVFPHVYDLNTFKKRAYIHLRQPVTASQG